MVTTLVYDESDSLWLLITSLILLQNQTTCLPVRLVCQLFLEDQMVLFLVSVPNTPRLLITSLILLQNQTTCLPVRLVCQLFLEDQMVLFLVSVPNTPRLLITSLILLQNQTTCLPVRLVCQLFLEDQMVLFLCFEAWYSSCPGLKVLAPYSSEDACGLLKATIRDPDHVVLLKNELLYGESFLVSTVVLDSRFSLPIGKTKELEVLRLDIYVVMTVGLLDFERYGESFLVSTVVLDSRFSLPIGKTKVFPQNFHEIGRRKGSHNYNFFKNSGLCTSGSSANLSMAAEILGKEGISTKVIILRSIRPLNRAIFNDSVKKIERLITVEEWFPQHPFS
ncbi:unnamed protein product [Ilex paraguariensis]|uniref:Pyruvate dehydrogenase E1 component subunit beta n=1 Tax=Ilex paraguariensis TaxID=185542 RepID=A0ABC8UQJ0_9AQUA